MRTSPRSSGRPVPSRCLFRVVPGEVWVGVAYLDATGDGVGDDGPETRWLVGVVVAPDGERGEPGCEARAHKFPGSMSTTGP